MRFVYTPHHSTETKHFTMVVGMPNHAMTPFNFHSSAISILESSTSFAKKMASISASISTPALLRNPSITARATPILGLASMSKMGKVRCSLEVKPVVASTSEDGAPKLRMGAPSLMAAAVAATMSSPAAMALVDDRMSTEGTGLPFGLSNNLLGWILFGVFGLIWTLYFVYTGSLEEDEESGLSL
ncbi:hypothetical protein L6452_43157 [Arctium lappa]|uniref:Uncharacterized protein n=1 Tax=Arctium lappa TaxID=4217 RepID=A0ACB8XKH7_ARCLA|nr:hypothetical protein L6452_43157 [Arctium lappa]